MNKKFKEKFVGAIATIGTIAVLTIPALASSYTSSLTMSANSTSTGSDRAYTGGTHHIAMTIKSIIWEEVGNKVQITLQHRGLFGIHSSVHTTTSPNMKSGTHTMYMGTHEEGEYRYYFDNEVSNVGANYSNGFTASPVTMTSN